MGATWIVAAELLLGVIREAIAEARGRGQTIVEGRKQWRF